MFSSIGTDYQKSISIKGEHHSRLAKAHLLLISAKHKVLRKYDFFSFSQNISNQLI
jgi:hypothetical protein